MRKKIYKAAHDDAPNLKDQIKSSDIYLQYMDSTQKQPQKRPLVSPIRMAYGGAFALLLLALFIVGPFDTEATYSQFYIEINPSIEAQINEDDDVIGVEALNEDGTDLIAALGNIHGMDVDEFVDLLVAEAINLKFIDDDEEHLIIFDVISDNVELQEHHAKRFNEALDRAQEMRANVHHLRGLGGAPTELERELSETYNLSPMHLRLIGIILAEDESLDFEDLADLSVGELRHLLDETKDYGGPNYRGPRHPFDDDDNGMPGGRPDFVPDMRQ